MNFSQRLPLSTVQCHELLIGECHFMYFIRSTDSIHLSCSSFSLVLNRILIIFIKSPSLFWKEEEICTLCSRNRPRWCHAVQWRHSIASTILPYMQSPAVDREKKLWRNLERTDQWCEHSRSYPAAVTERTVQKKGSNTFLRNAFTLKCAQKQSFIHFSHIFPVPLVKEKNRYLFWFLGI